MKRAICLQGPLAGLIAALITFSAAAQQALPPAYAVQAQPLPPRAVVEQFQSALSAILKDSNSLGFSGRYARLDPVIRSTFNLPFMAATAAGTHWSAATDEQKRHFIEAFSQMTTAIYAMRFDVNDGEFFALTGEEQGGPSSVLVRSEIRKPDGNHVAVNYLLRNMGGPWQIVDVYAMGRVSELAGREANYSEVLSSESLDDLASTMEAEVAKMRRHDALRQATRIPDPEDTARR